MKNLSIITLLILVLASCSKDAKIEIKEVEKYNNYNPSNAKQEVLDFLKTTKTYNNLNAKTSTTYPDREIGEAKWVMEGASNYLQNTNLALKNDETIKYDITIDNKTSSNGVLMMDGSDMSNKFDYVFSQVQAHKNSTGKDAKLIDYKIISADNSKSTIEVYAVYGISNGGGLATSWPTASITTQQVAQLYTDSINNEVTHTSVGSTNNGNGTVNQGFWYSSVSILSTYVLPTQSWGGAGVNEIGVGNLYFTQMGSNSPTIFPNNLLPQYFLSTKSEINSQINSFYVNPGFVVGLISCNMDWGYIPADGRTFHVITEIITGNKQNY